jgi:hypothetical protein
MREDLKKEWLGNGVKSFRDIELKEETWNLQFVEELNRLLNQNEVVMNTSPPNKSALVGGDQRIQ